MGFSQSPAWYLIQSTLPRESRRLDAHVIRLLYAALSLGVLLATFNMPVNERGHAMLAGLTVLHCAMVVLLSVRLSGDIAGDRTSGVVGLLALSGLSSRQVLISRLSLSVISFLSVWIVRIPLLVLAWMLGGIQFRQIAFVEILLLGVFILVFGVGLLHAHYCRDRMSARLVFVLPGLLDFFLSLPSLALSTLSVFQLVSVPNWAHEVVNSLRFGCASRGIYSTLQIRNPSVLNLIPTVLHGILGILAIYAWKIVYFRCLDEAGESEPASPVNQPAKVRAGSSQTRPSRACWNDALAWQTYRIHSNGSTTILIRGFVSISVSVTAILMRWTGSTPYPELAVMLLIITSMVMLFSGQGKASDCLQRELREKTLPSLMTLPYTPIELCDGWGRGAWWIMIADLPLYLTTLILIWMVLPTKMAIVLMIGVVLLLSCRAFLILSPLVPFSIRGILTGIGLVSCPIAVFAVCTPIAVHLNPWAGFAIAGILAVGWRALCRWMIPSWFQRKQEALE